MILGLLPQIVGEKSFETALEEMFDVLQHPKLNKQVKPFPFTRGNV